jgi:hypothetical protein
MAACWEREKKETCREQPACRDLTSNNNSLPRWKQTEQQDSRMKGRYVKFESNAFAMSLENGHGFGWFSARWIYKTACKVNAANVQFPNVLPKKYLNSMDLIDLYKNNPCQNFGKLP